MKKWWRIGLLAVGLALFAWFIQRTGWADIRNTFAKLGPWMLVALVPCAVVFTIDCVGWRFTFGPTARKGIPFRVVWSIRLIGEAINNVIPSMYVGGEAVKVGLLKRRGVPVVTAASAAVRRSRSRNPPSSPWARRWRRWHCPRNTQKLNGPSPPLRCWRSRVWRCSSASNATGCAPRLSVGYGGWGFG